MEAIVQKALVSAILEAGATAGTTGYSTVPFYTTGIKTLLRHNRTDLLGQYTHAFRKIFNLKMANISEAKKTNAILFMLHGNM